MIGRVNVQVLVFKKHPMFRILILQRVPGRNSYWQPISGGIERGEKPIDTVKREVFEETGLKVELLGFLGAYQLLKNCARKIKRR